MNHIRENPESGNAQVEFIGIVVVLLIPILYFMVTMSRVQAANLAATSAAHAIARNYALAAEPAASDSVNTLIATLAFQDQGFEPTSTSLDFEVGCQTTCSEDAVVTASVTYALKLPLLSWLPGSVEISSAGYSYRGEMRASE